MTAVAEMGAVKAAVDGVEKVVARAAGATVEERAVDVTAAARAAAAMVAARVAGEPEAAMAAAAMAAAREAVD